MFQTIKTPSVYQGLTHVEASCLNHKKWCDYQSRGFFSYARVFIVFSSASRRVLWSIWNSSRFFRRILVIFSFECLIEIPDYTRVCLKNRLLIQQLAFLSVFRIHHFVRIKAAILVMGKPTVDMDMKVSVSTYSRK